MKAESASNSMNGALLRTGISLGVGNLIESSDAGL